MKKPTIVEFEDWNIYDGFAEGNGRNEKIWLKSPTDEIGLFKFPKIDPKRANRMYELFAQQTG